METKNKWILIIIGIVAVIGIGVGIYFGVSKTSPKPEVPQQLLLKTSDGSIKLFDCNTKKIEKVLVKEKDYKITGFANFFDSTIYYGTTEPRQAIRSTLSDFGEIPEISKKWTKTAMTIDNTHDKMYVIDEPAGEVHVVDITYGYTKTVMSHLNKPKDIVLDVEKGLMFILQSSSIIQAYMDGSEVQEIIKISNLRAITIDTKSKLLYFADSKNIGSYNYNKEDHKISTVINLGNILSLTFMNDKLFYVTDELFENTLYACSWSNGTFMIETLYNDGIIEDIQAYNVQPSNITNRCNSESSCEELCLLTNTHSCACKDGWELLDDMKTCVSEENLLIATLGGKIKKYDFKNVNLTDTLVIDKNYEITAFDSYEKETIYYATTEPKSLVYSSSDKYKNLFHHTADWGKNELAIDNIAKNVYILDKLAGNVYVAGMSAAGNILLSNIREPLDIALDPEMGLMFILQETNILQYNMDGTVKKERFIGNYYKSMAIDRINKKLFIANFNSVMTYDYLDNQAVSSPVGLEKHEIIKKLVYSNNQLFAITDTIKYTSSNIRAVKSCSLGYDTIQSCTMKTILENNDVLDIKIQSKTKDKLEHPCNDDNNNDCSMLCLSSNTEKRYTCKCSIFWTPENDGCHCTGSNC